MEQIAKIEVYGFASLGRDYGFEIPYRWGVLYCFALPGGRVKIGKTCDPVSRLRTHDSDKRKFCGEGLGDVWISKPHSNFSATERLAHKALGEFRVHAEVFECEIRRALEAIEGLNFEYVTYDAAADRARSEAAGKSFAASMEAAFQQHQVQVHGADQKAILDHIEKTRAIFAAYFVATNPANHKDARSLAKSDGDALYLFCLAMQGLFTAILHLTIRHNKVICECVDDFHLSGIMEGDAEANQVFRAFIDAYTGLDKDAVALSDDMLLEHLIKMANRAGESVPENLAEIAKARGVDLEAV